MLCYVSGLWLAILAPISAPRIAVLSIDGQVHCVALYRDWYITCQSGADDAYENYFVSFDLLKIKNNLLKLLREICRSAYVQNTKKYCIDEIRCFWNLNFTWLKHGSRILPLIFFFSLEFKIINSRLLLLLLHWNSKRPLANYKLYYIKKSNENENIFMAWIFLLYSNLLLRLLTCGRTN